MNVPAPSTLQCLLSYSADSGRLIWRSRPRSDFRSEQAFRAWNTRYAGQVAGCQSGEYRTLTINGRRYWEHRIVWAVAYGEHPPERIDHVDGNGTNNTLQNIRRATAAQNMMNQRGWGRLPKGVCFHAKNNKFNARITIAKKCRSLGYFDTAEQAHAAYCAAAAEHFGEFARFQ